MRLPITTITRRVATFAASAMTLACATGGRATMDETDTLMQRYQGNVPGASLLVVREDKPIVRRAYGMSNLETATAATPQTNYRLASVTKQFTAAAILLLAEDGKLALKDPVRRWLVSLPAILQPVTIEHLLTHTSGIIDYENVMSSNQTEQLHDADVLKLLESQDSTYFAPGSTYRYSNSGYSLLALIVQNASGKTFATFLHDRIFAPLGMDHTVAYENGISTVSNRAFGYTMRNGTWRKKDQSTTSAVLGDGGIYSSIEDMAKWDAALSDSRLLNDESRRLAFAPHTDTNDHATKYGYGWRITGDQLWHSGETSGFRNVIVRYPASKLTVVLLTNRDDPEPYATALAVAGHYR